MKWMALVCIVLVLMAGVGEKTTHFNVKYSDSKEFVPGISRTLEDSYRTVNNYFGDLPKSIKVIVIDGDQMDNVGKHVEAFSAWNQKSSTIVLRADTLKDKKSLGVVSTHEITHLAINPILEEKGGKDFAWMEEGTCMVLSNEPLDDLKVAKYIVSQGFLTRQEIAKAVNNDNYAVCKNGYLQSFSLCKYIAGRYGINRLVDIIRYPSADFDTAFSKVTGNRFGPVYDAWKASVEALSHGAPARTQIVSMRGCLRPDITS